MTTYQILARDESGFWKEAGIEEAHSASAAVTARYMKNPDGGIVAMVAVPQKSWRPTPIRSEPQPPKVILGSPVVLDEQKPQA